MRAEEPHRLARRGAHRRQAEPLDQPVEDGLRRLAGLDDAGGDAERPGRGRDQERVRLHARAAPVAGGELVLDQPVGGGGVRHAQQRLGQHHQREALLGRQRIGVQEILDAAEPAGAARGWPRSAGSRRVDARSAAAERAAAASRPARDLLVGRRVGRAKRRPARCIRGRRNLRIFSTDTVGHGAVPAECGLNLNGRPMLPSRRNDADLGSGRGARCSQCVKERPACRSRLLFA